MSREMRYVYCPALFAGNIRLLRKLQDSDYWSVHIVGSALNLAHPKAMRLKDGAGGRMFRYVSGNEIAVCVYDATDANKAALEMLHPELTFETFSSGTATRLLKHFADICSKDVLLRIDNDSVGIFYDASRTKEGYLKLMGSLYTKEGETGCLVLTEHEVESRVSFFSDESYTLNV